MDNVRLYGAVLSALLMSGAASAQEATDGMLGGRLYIGIKAGPNFIGTNTHLVTNNLFPTPIGGTVDYDDGLAATVQTGLAFGSGLRVEGEFGYRYNSVNQIFKYGTNNGRGSMNNYAAMANVLYDIPASSMPIELPFQPYLGVGIGVADYAPDHIRGDGMPYPNYVGGPDSWGLAWQAIGGSSVKLDDNVAVSLEYRYFERVADHPVGVGNDYHAHSVLLGMRYTFGSDSAPPSMPAVTPVETAKPCNCEQKPTYLVFFEFAKYGLTEGANTVVDKAAHDALQKKPTIITVTGHTDTVGSVKYNLRLSERRAQAVAARLEQDGVPQSEISIQWKGKSDLLVPTGDGVREPQNRRVTIVFDGGATS